MKKQLQILRFSAKLLLVFVVVVLVTGLLTAKPALLEPASFSTYRWLHSRLLPLLFVPLAFVHAGVGIWVMLKRSKRLQSPRFRTAALVAWGATGVALTGLTLVEAKPSPSAALALVEAEPAASVEAFAAGGAEPSAGGAEPSAVRAGGNRGGRGGAGGSAEPSALPTTARAEPPANPRPKRPAVHGPAPKPAVRDASSPQATAASPASASELSGPQLIGQRCVGCHGMDVVVAEKRTPAEWSTVLDTMIGYGAQLSPAERRLVMRYLPRK